MAPKKKDSAAAEAPKNGAKDLYEALGVERTATQAEIKRAYRCLALKLHPDKNTADPARAQMRVDAATKFQALQKVYDVLGDEEKRRAYDTTGFTGDEGVGGFGDLSSVRVSAADIAAFESSYRGSEEEAADLKKLYAAHNGKMKAVFEYQLCSRPEEDSYRFMQLLSAAVAVGELPQSKAFEKWAKGVASKGPPSASALASGSAAEDAASMALVAAIRGNAAKRSGSFLDNLAAKYAQPLKEGAKKGKKSHQ